MCSDTRIEADTLNNVLSVQPLHFSISIQLVEVGNTKRKVGVCKQLHSFCFGESHK